jgi:hypothetical protein
MTDFVQAEPRVGEPATEKTEVWVAFDNDRVYISFRCWDSAPNLRVAKEMRRDNGNIWNGDDNIAFLLDTFFDHRNGFQFTLNSIGGRQDAQVFNERQWVGDWNTVWDFKTGQFEGGLDGRDNSVQVAALPARSDQTWASTSCALTAGRTSAVVPAAHSQLARPARPPAGVARWRPRWSVCRRPRARATSKSSPTGSPTRRPIAASGSDLTADGGVDVSTA